MSAWEILQAPLRKVGQLPRPELRRVPIPARRMPMVPFAGLVIALLAIGMVGLLLLNTHLQDRAFEIRAAQRESTDLAHRVSDLESEVNRANSPANLAGRASELGMVPNPNGGWDVKRGGGERSSGHFDTKREAIDQGRLISRNQGTEFRIHNLNGRIAQSDSHGHDPKTSKG